MGVEACHPLYSKRQKQWQVIRDCIEGEDAIKNKGEVYLPRAKGYSIQRYEAYKLRAEWVNYTRRVLTGLHGMVFRKRPSITYPEGLKNVIENVDRRGTNVFRFASNTFKDALPVTFGGLLVDMPQNNARTKLDAEEQKIYPYMKYYKAENIINWKTKIVNGIEQLSMVVLAELYEDAQDEFSHDIKIQYRVCEIKEGFYQQRLFKPQGSKNKSGIIEYQIEEIPISINGNKLTEIPFYPLFEPEPTTPFMLDLARANVSHYRKSADYENGVHLTTIPTGYVTGQEQPVGEDGEPESIGLGEDAFLFFENENSKVGNLCFAGEGLTHSEKALELSMSNMAILGSRLVVTEKGTSESADSAKIHRAGENASLADLANYVSDAFTKALKTIAEWMDVEGTVLFELNTDYDTLAFDPNALNSIANLSRENKLPLPYIFDILKAGEYTPTDATLEEYCLLLEMEASGYTPLEIMENFRKMKNGEKITVVNKKPKEEKPLENSNDKPPEDITTNKEMKNEE